MIYHKVYHYKIPKSSYDASTMDEVEYSNLLNHLEEFQPVDLTTDLLKVKNPQVLHRASIYDFDEKEASKPENEIMVFMEEIKSYDTLYNVVAKIKKIIDDESNDKDEEEISPVNAPDEELVPV